MQRVGSRAQVMHGNAKMTSGGLTKKHLTYNINGKIVSKKASKTAKKLNKLVKAGYITKKGQFGAVRTMKGGELNEDIKGNVWHVVDLLLDNPSNFGNPAKYTVKYQGLKQDKIDKAKEIYNTIIKSDYDKEKLRNFLIEYLATKYKYQIESHGMNVRQRNHEDELYETITDFLREFYPTESIPINIGKIHNDYIQEKNVQERINKLKPPQI